MKKIFYLFILYIVISFSIKGQCDIRMNDIYTPKGSPVVTFLMCESSIEKRKSLDQYYAQRYPHAVQIKTYDNCSSTRKFNCHGYAWLRVEQNIDRWIGTGWPNDIVDPEKIYITDGSYTEVSQETYPGKVFWASGDHTAITTEQQGIFISKWNEWPLMKHSWNYSPFGSSNLKYYKKTPTSYSISGPTSVCNQATYTIKNLPQGATVQWNFTNDRLQLISGQGTETAVFRKNGNGKCILTANVHINNSLISQLEKELSVGLPGIYMYGDYLYDHNGNPKRFFTESQPNPCALESDEDVDRWDWKITSGNISTSGDKNQYATIYPLPSSSLSFMVEIRALNKCGWTGWKRLKVNIRSSMISAFSLSPNPAMDVVTLQLMETDEVSGLSVLSTDRSTYEIQLWSGMTMLRSFRTTEPTFQIPMAGLPAGLYFVRVVKDGQTYTQKLIKK